MFQNINGLPIQSQHPKNESVRDTMLRHNIDILGISEVNIAWHKVRGEARLGECTAEWFEARHLTRAWNQTNTITEQSQFGGVALITRNKTAHCISEQGADTTGLGRWAWTQYRGRQGHYTRVVGLLPPSQKRDWPSFGVQSASSLLFIP